MLRSPILLLADYAREELFGKRRTGADGRAEGSGQDVGERHAGAASPLRGVATTNARTPLAASPLKGSPFASPPPAWDSDTSDEEGDNDAAAAQAATAGDSAGKQQQQQQQQQPLSRDSRAGTGDRPAAGGDVPTPYATPAPPARAATGAAATSSADGGQPRSATSSSSTRRQRPSPFRPPVTPVDELALQQTSSAWPGSSPPPRVLTGPNDNLVVLVYPPAVAAAGGGGGGGGGGQAHVLPPASQPPLMVVGNLDAALAQAAESGAGSVNVGGSPAVAAPCNENAPSLQQHKHPAAALGSANHGADEAGAALQRNPLGPRVRRQGVWRAVAVALAVLCAAVVAATVLHGGGGGATAGFDVAAAFWSLFSRLPAASKESVQPAAAVNVATPPSTKPSSVVTALPVAAGVVDDVVHKPRQHLGALLPAALSPGAVAVAAAQCAGGLCPSAQPAAAAAPPSATTQVQQPPPAHGAAATAQPQQAASSPSRKSTVSASDGGAAAALSLPKASPPPPPPPPVPERSVKSMEQQLPTGVARPATPVSDAEAEAARAGIEAVAAAPAFALRRRHVLGFTAGAASVFIAAALYAACRSPSVALAASSILSTSRSLCQRLVAAAARPAGTAPRTAAAPTHSHHSGEASSLTVGGGRSIQLRSRLVVATADTAATATHHRPR